MNEKLTRTPSEGHAHIWKIRIEGEGTSATALESYFGLVTARIQAALKIPMGCGAQTPDG